MAGALENQSNWQTLLESGGILLTEDTAAKTLVEGLNEKEALAGVTLSVDPSTAYRTLFAPMEKNFCTKFDQALVELAPNFLDNEDQPFAGSLSTLAAILGDEQVITQYLEDNPLSPYTVLLSSAYISQRYAMLNLLVNPASDIYSMPVIVKTAKIILPTTAYMEDQTGTWASEDITIATMSDDVVTVVSQGVCEFTFTGDDPNNSGTVKAYCLLEPAYTSNYVLKVSYATQYAATASGYGVSARFYFTNNGTTVGLILDGTMDQTASFPIVPTTTVAFRTLLTSSEIPGDLLLWAEEVEGTCELPEGAESRVYLDFCSAHPTSGNSTVSEYQLDLRNTMSIGQLTFAKLIKNDETQITGIRLFAPSGTVFTNYKIRIGITKPNATQTYNFGLLESGMATPVSYENAGKYGRLSDGSILLAEGWSGKYLHRLGPTFGTGNGGADLLTGNQLTEVGKAYKLTIRLLESSSTSYLFTSGDTATTSNLTLYYADGSPAVSISLMPKDSVFVNGVASTTFVSEQVVDFVGISHYGAVRIDRPYVRFILNLEEISVDDLDMTGITLYSDSKIVNQQDIKIVYEPAAIAASPTASQVTWSSSDTEVATIDSNGHVTIHADGNCTFTATSVKHPNISGSITATCYYAQDDNMVANLIKCGLKTYSQGGLTLRHNSDGTITFNGTTTNSNTSYYRNVIWPIGNNKTVWDVLFPRQGLTGVWLLWWEYVSGSIEGASTFSGGEVSHELYVINHNNKEILKIQARYDSPNESNRENYCKSMNSTDGIRLISWGFQVAKGTKFNNYTVRVGIKKFTEQQYHGGELEAFLPVLTGYTKFDANKDTIWTRFPDGSLGGYTPESLAAFPTAAGYVRLTSQYAYNSSLSNLLTGDEIGEAGHNYRFKVDLLKLTYDRIAATELTFGLAYPDGTTAAEIKVVDPNDFVSSGTNINLTNSSYTVDVTLTAPIDCVYRYYNQLKVKNKEDYFMISLQDLSRFVVYDKQTITINDSSYSETDIIVDYGGYLYLTSGAIVQGIKEDGGYVRVESQGAAINGITYTFTSNVMSGRTFDKKGSATTIHSNTVLESSILTNSTHADVFTSGYVNSVTVTSGAVIYPYYNAVIENCVVESGGSIVTPSLAAGGAGAGSGVVLSNTIVNRNGYVRPDHTDFRTSNITVNSGGYVYFGRGSAVNVIENGGEVDCTYPENISFASNVFSGTFNVPYDNPTVHSGTTATSVVLTNTAYMSAYSSGVVLNPEVQPTATLIIDSGAIVTNIKEAGGGVWNLAWNDIEPSESVTFASTVTSNITISGWWWATVHSGTTLASVIVTSDQLFVYNGGFVSDVILQDQGSVYVSSGGLVNSVTFDDYAKIHVSSGGSAVNIDFVPFLGLVYDEPGAHIEYKTNLSGVYYGLDGELATNVPTVSGLSISGSGSTWNNIYVCFDGTATSCTAYNYGYIQVISGGSVNNTTISSGGQLYLYNGTATSITNCSGAEVTVKSTGVIGNLTCSNGAEFNLESGGKLTGKNTFASSASVNIASGGIVNFNLNNVTPGAAVRIAGFDKVTSNDSVVYTLTLGSNTINGTYNLASACNSFSSSIELQNVSGTSIGILNTSEDCIADASLYELVVSANILAVIKSVYIPPISGTIINDGETVTVLPDEKYIDTTINSGGSMIVSSAGKITNTIVNYGATLDLVGASDVRLDSIIENGGYVNTHVNNNNEGFGFASNTFSGLTIANSNSTTVHSGTTATDIVVDNTGKLEVKIGGVASTVTVNPFGHVRVFASGSVINLVENGGDVSAHSNAIVSYVPNVFTSKTVGSCTMHSGTTGTDLFCTWGDMYIFNGGLGSNVSISHGGITVYGTAINIDLSGWAGANAGEGGTISNISAKASCTYVNIYPGGYASNIDLSPDSHSWGHFTVSSGGIIDGIIRTNQVSGINVISGGIINFNLTNQTPDNAPLLSPLSAVHGEPTYTLTMPDEELSAGIYNLADGLTSEGFHDFIHLQDTSRTELNHVAVGVDYASASARYALDVIDDTSLVLSKGEWDLIIDGNSKVAISNSYGNVLVRLGDLSCGNGTTIDNLQVLYGGYVNGGGAGTVISNCTEHGGNIELGVVSKIQYFTPNYISGLQMISGKNIQLHSGTTLFDITGVNSNYIRIFSGASVVNPVVQNFREFTVHPGGVIINPTVPQGNAFAISSGGTALHVSIAYIERITITNGAYIEWINEEGNLIVVSSGVSNVDTDMTSATYLVIQSGTLNATSGAILSNVSTFGTNNIVNVLSNASASHIDLNRGTATISQGVVDSITLYSGVINMADGATVSKIGDSNYNNNGLVNISSGAIYDGGNSYVGKYNTVTVYSGGSFVNASGIALSIDGKSGCYISHVMPQVGRIRVTVAPDTYINAYYTYGWRTMESAYFSGHVLSNAGGGLDSVTILSGGSAEDITMKGGTVTVSAGGILTYPIMSGGTLVVMSGGSAIDIDSQGGVVDSRAGATVLYLNYTYVSSGGVAIVTEPTDSRYQVEGVLHVKENGVVSGNKVYGTLIVSSGGIASDTELIAGGLVISGGEATGVSAVCVSSPGVVYNYAINVRNGGILNDATASGGYLYISSGGTMNSAFLHSSASATIYPDGLANNTYLVGGNVYVASGGIANNTVVSSGGYLYVSSGGTALNISRTPTEGRVVSQVGAYVTYATDVLFTGVYYGSNGTLLSHTDSMASKTLGSTVVMEVFDSGIATNTNVSRGGSVYINSNGVLSNTTLNAGGNIFISNGGVANNTTINSGGSFYVYSGGTATSVNAKAGAALKLTIASDTCIAGTYAGSAIEFRNGSGSNFKLTQWDYLDVLEGCVVDNITVENLCSMSVDNGGVANNVTVSGGQVFLYINSGGTASNVNVSGDLHVNAGGVVYNTTVCTWSTGIHTGGIASTITVVNGGYLVVSEGAVATDIIENGGYVGIVSGATATFASHVFSGVLSSGSATVHSNTVASNITISSGYLHVLSSGIADNVIVNTKGGIFVSSGGIATNISENGGYVSADENASVTFASTLASGLILSSGVRMTVHELTTATDITLSTGNLYVYSNGICSNVMVNAGILEVSSGGSAVNVDYPPTGTGMIISRTGAYITYTSQYSGVLYTSAGSQYIVDSLSDMTVTWSTVGVICAMDNGVVENVSMTGGRLFARSGGVVSNASVSVSNDAAYLYGYADGLFESVSMTNDIMGYCCMTLYPLASASNIVVGACTRLIVSSGATATDVVEDGGYVEIADGASVTFASHVIDHTTSNMSRITIHSNTTLSGADLIPTPGWPISCYMAGGTILDATLITDYAVLTSGYLSNVTFSGTPYRLILNDNVASNVAILGGNTYLDEGSFTSVRIATWTMASENVHMDHVKCEGYLQLINGIVNGLDIDSACTVRITSSIVSNVNIYTGAMFCNPGCTIDSVTIYDQGELYIYSNVSVTNIVVSSNGILHVASDGSALNVTSNAGAIIEADEGAVVEFNA